MVKLLVSRESNGVLGNYYSISAYDGDTYLGQEIYAGYTKRERRARIMGKEIEDKIKAGIIAAAPDQESAAIAKSMIDSGKIIIMGF
jgi:hypothetical protein